MKFLGMEYSLEKFTWHTKRICKPKQTKKHCIDLSTRWSDHTLFTSPNDTRQQPPEQSPKHHWPDPLNLMNSCDGRHSIHFAALMRGWINTAVLWTQLQYMKQKSSFHDIKFIDYFKTIMQGNIGEVLKGSCQLLYSRILLSLSFSLGITVNNFWLVTSQLKLLC